MALPNIAPLSAVMPTRRRSRLDVIIHPSRDTAVEKHYQICGKCSHKTDTRQGDPDLSSFLNAPTAFIMICGHDNSLIMIGTATIKTRGKGQEKLRLRRCLSYTGISRYSQTVGRPRDTINAARVELNASLCFVSDDNKSPLNDVLLLINYGFKIDLILHPIDEDW